MSAVVYSFEVGSRTNNYLHRQVVALRRRCDVKVLAAEAVNVDEYRYENVVTPPKTSILRVLRASQNQLRAFGVTANRLAFAERVYFAASLLAAGVQPKFAYAMFGWNGIELMSVLSLANLRRVPLVVHLAGSDLTAPRARGRRYLPALRRLFQRADLLLCGSEFLVDVALRLGAPRAKLIRHYLGIPIPAGHVREKKPEDRNISILACSRFVEVKGVLQTVEVFARAAAGNPQLSMTMVGDGPLLPACSALARKLHVDDRIFFRGSVPHSEVYAEMRRADVFIQMNRRTRSGAEEAIGGTLLEAAAHSLPVIATQTGGVAEAVIDGKTGVMVAPDDVDSAAAALGLLSSSSQRRAELGGHGRALVEEMHNSDKQDEMFSKLLADRFLR